VSENDRSLNAECQRLADAVAKLSGDDPASLRAVRRSFTRLERAVSRVSRDLDRLAGGVGPQESPPTHVRE
jgi:hypothetical protein